MFTCAQIFFTCSQSSGLTEELQTETNPDNYKLMTVMSWRKLYNILLVLSMDTCEPHSFSLCFVFFTTSFVVFALFE